MSWLDQFAGQGMGERVEVHGEQPCDREPGEGQARHRERLVQPGELFVLAVELDASEPHGFVEGTS
jgi:hypothetical protein